MAKDYVVAKRSCVLCKGTGKFVHPAHDHIFDCIRCEGTGVVTRVVEKGKLQKGKVEV